VLLLDAATLTVIVGFAIYRIKWAEALMPF
jgi:hypothetical protein